MKKVKIRDEYITLMQFLKYEDIVSSGGEARYYIEEEMIYVNDVLEKRKRKKLYDGDRIVLPTGEEFQIVGG